MSAREAEVRLTPLAERDLEDVLLYSQRTWGAERSASYRTALVQGLGVLGSHPQIGRQRDDVFPGCRSLNVRQHVIYYHQPAAAVIVVLRLLHHRRDPGALVEALD